MNELIKYLQKHLKCAWLLKQNSLRVENKVLMYSFIQRVNELHPVEVVIWEKDAFVLCFNTKGIQDESDNLSGGFQQF